MIEPSPVAYPPDPRITGAETLLEIVADGGPRLGFGHLGRCLALWDELGERAVFRVGDAAANDFLSARGVPIAAGGEAPIVLLDRAAPAGEQQVRALQAHGRRVALLDDLGPARALADLVIDPPTAAAWPSAAGLRLAGFEHVLLRREVLAARARTVRGEQVLICIGGSDPDGLTPLLADALAAGGVDVRSVLGPGYRGERPAAGAVLDRPGEFVPALAAAGVLVAGYGHSLLEAAHLGVPAIAVVSRAEQLQHARAFCRHGSARLLDATAGHAALHEVAAIATELLADPAQLAAMALRGPQLIDGHGAPRVAQALEGLL
ncbi:MAG TPA: hypothetical protein VLJ42_11945 [Solirubrobacteraceae bacterium]|nr:hypothetical protein [Solirubrobacteraceae bacterium]